MRDQQGISTMINGVITAREGEIFRLVSVGLSTKEIAEQLNLSYHTIKSHRKNLMQKMGANNMAALIRRGFEIGIIG